MHQRILVPFDGSPTSNAGIDEAIKLAKLTGASIRLMYVLDTTPLAIHAAALTGDIRECWSRRARRCCSRGRAAWRRAACRWTRSSRIPMGNAFAKSSPRRPTVEGRSDRHRHARPPRRAAAAPRQRCRADRALGAGSGAPGSDDAARTRGPRRSAGRERGERLIVRWASFRCGARSSGGVRVPRRAARLKHRRDRLARIDEGQGRLAVRAENLLNFPRSSWPWTCHTFHLKSLHDLLTYRLVEFRADVHAAEQQRQPMRPRVCWSSPIGRVR